MILYAHNTHVIFMFHENSIREKQNIIIYACYEYNNLYIWKHKKNVIKISYLRIYSSVNVYYNFHARKARKIIVNYIFIYTYIVWTRGCEIKFSTRVCKIRFGTRYPWHVTRYPWHVTRDTLPVTRYPWLVTRDPCV